MTSHSSKPAQSAAHPQRKANWVRPALKRLAAGDAELGAGPIDDGYAGGITIS